MAVTIQPKPKIKQPTDVILRVTTAGICGGDLHRYDGRTALDKGTVVGNEFMGVIAMKSGDAGPGIKAGEAQTVSASWHRRRS